MALSPFPAKTTVTGVGGWLTEPWRKWFLDLYTRVVSVPAVLAHVTATAQAAAITTTDATAVPATGVYRVSYRARISQAASSSSSLTVTLGWTDTGVACSSAGAAMTANTTSTVQSGSLLVSATVGSSITYATAYASVGATPMQYALDVVVESVP